MSRLNTFWQVDEPISNEDIQKAKKSIIDQFQHDVEEEIDPAETKRKDDKKSKRSDDEAVDEVFRRDLLITCIVMAAVMWKYS